VTAIYGALVMFDSKVARGSGRRPAAVIAAMLAAATLLAPAAASAHVNRTVGPYTFLVVLIEEPYFSSNHAGFRFWVHRGETPIAGLDRTLHAQAIGHGRTVDLEVSPWDADQLYIVDRGLDGQAFDPQGGGSWSLRLTGSVEGMAVDESFAVQFPAYPRVANPSAGASVAAVGGDAELFPPYLPLLLLGVAAVLALRAVRRRRVSLGPLALSSELDR